MKLIPLFGSGVDGVSKVITSQRRVNCFYDLRNDGDKAQTVLLGTFGLLFWIALANAPIRGWRVVGSFLYIVAGGGLYRVTAAGGITTLGTLSTHSGKVGISDNAVHLAIVDGVSLYCYTLTTGSYSQAALNAAGSFGVVTDGNFPNGATTIAFINGRMLVEKSGTRQYYVSGAYDVTLWTPVVYATKENYSDNLVAVDVFNGLVVLWGDNSIEFWQDIGSVPLPYQRIQGTTQQWGLAAKSSRLLLNNMIIFLGKNPYGTIQVIRLNGYTPERISTADIEDLIHDFGTYSDAVACSHTAFGHTFYQLSFPTANRTLVYDLMTGIWHEAQTGLAITARHMAELSVVFNSKNYVSDSTTGRIYMVDEYSYTDDGTSIRRQVTSAHIHTDGDTFSVSTLFLDMETGIGLQSGQGSDPNISLEISRDGGRTFGYPKVKSIGKIGQYKNPRVVWRRLGRGRDFVFRFTLTDPVPFVVIAGSANLGA